VTDSGRFWVPELLIARMSWPWVDIFAELKERGMDKVDLIISDGHKGTQAAVERVFPGSSW